jgi:hypothetical protein
VGASALPQRSLAIARRLAATTKARRRADVFMCRTFTLADASSSDPPGPHPAL